MGAQGRFGNASGRARDGFWTPKCRPKANRGTPWAGQERPGGVHKRPRGAPETLQEPPGPLPRRSEAPFASPNAVGSACGSIFERFWSTRSSFEVRFVSLLPVFYRCRMFFARRTLVARKYFEKTTVFSMFLRTASVRRAKRPTSIKHWQERYETHFGAAARWSKTFKNRSANASNCVGRCEER